ncbi:MAG: winged helix DNA-binding domain-containing protein [Acetobacteraceae bacterium]|nr:winged helix DNA-binding domain-containing protein [Acetobacteraceae bacterium]
MKVPLEQAAALAIERHGLAPGAALADAAEAAQSVLGLHAQLLTSAAMSAAARVAGYDRARFEQELYERRALVKVWCMRGTLHLLASRDLPLFLGAVMRPRGAGYQAFFTQCGFSPAEIEALPGKVARALEQGPATRRRLHELVPDLARIPGAQWGQDVKDFCYLGFLVHAEPEGNEARFALARTWLKDWVEETALESPTGAPEEAAGRARAELLRRYLRAYGPASTADFAYWAGFDRVGPAEDARRRLGEAVAEVEVEGSTRPLLMLAADMPALAAVKPSRTAFPLPRFDPLVLGLKDRQRFVDDAWRQRLFLPGGFVAATLWSRGRVVGIWDYRVRGSRLLVDAAEFRPLSGEERDGLIEGWRALAPALSATEVEARFTAWKNQSQSKAEEG